MSFIDRFLNREPKSESKRTNKSPETAAPLGVRLKELLLANGTCNVLFIPTGQTAESNQTRIGQLGLNYRKGSGSLHSLSLKQGIIQTLFHFGREAPHPSSQPLLGKPEFFTDQDISMVQLATAGGTVVVFTNEKQAPELKSKVLQLQALLRNQTNNRQSIPPAQEKKSSGREAPSRRASSQNKDSTPVRQERGQTPLNNVEVSTLTPEGKPSPETVWFDRDTCLVGHQGARESMQDVASYLRFAENRIQAAVVADGMGGGEMGGYIASVAVKEASIMIKQDVGTGKLNQGLSQEQLHAYGTELFQKITAAVEADEKIRDKSQNKENATIIITVQVGDNLLILHRGDCRGHLHGIAQGKAVAQPLTRPHVLSYLRADRDVPGIGRPMLTPLESEAARVTSSEIGIGLRYNPQPDADPNKEINYSIEFHEQANPLAQQVRVTRIPPGATHISAMTDGLEGIIRSLQGVDGEMERSTIENRLKTQPNLEQILTRLNTKTGLLDKMRSQFAPLQDRARHLFKNPREFARDMLELAKNQSRRRPNPTKGQDNLVVVRMGVLPPTQ